MRYGEHLGETSLGRKYFGTPQKMSFHLHSNQDEMNLEYSDHLPSSVSRVLQDGYQETLLHQSNSTQRYEDLGEEPKTINSLSMKNAENETAEETILNMNILGSQHEPVLEASSRNDIDIISEAADLLTPFYMSMNVDKSEKHQVKFSGNKFANSLKEEDTSFTKSEKFVAPFFPSDKDDSEPSYRETSVIQIYQKTPEIVFTKEEMLVLRDQESLQRYNLLNVARQDLYEARIQNYLGQMSHRGMLMIVAAGRKAQNYYHYLTMKSLPYFEDLSDRLID